MTKVCGYTSPFYDPAACERCGAEVSSVGKSVPYKPPHAKSLDDSTYVKESDKNAGTVFTRN